ncbi:hypothetical protein MMPV_004896 [Pyropia vietnamensis]
MAWTAAPRRGRTDSRHPPTRHCPVVMAASVPPPDEGPIGRRGRLAAAAAKTAKKAKTKRRPVEAATVPATGVTAAAAGTAAQAGRWDALTVVGGGVVKVCSSRTCRRDGDSANVLAAFQAATAGTGVMVRKCGCLGFCTGTGTAVQTGGTRHPSLGVDAVGRVLAEMGVVEKVGARGL